MARLQGRMRGTNSASRTFGAAKEVFDDKFDGVVVADRSGYVRGGKIKSVGISGTQNFAALNGTVCGPALVGGEIFSAIAALGAGLTDYNVRTAPVYGVATHGAEYVVGMNNILDPADYGLVEYPRFDLASFAPAGGVFGFFADWKVNTTAETSAARLTQAWVSGHVNPGRVVRGGMSMNPAVTSYYNGSGGAASWSVELESNPGETAFGAFLIPGQVPAGLAANRDEITKGVAIDYAYVSDYVPDLNTPVATRRTTYGLKTEFDSTKGKLDFLVVTTADDWLALALFTLNFFGAKGLAVIEALIGEKVTIEALARAGSRAEPGDVGVLLETLIESELDQTGGGLGMWTNALKSALATTLRKL